MLSRISFRFLTIAVALLAISGMSLGAQDPPRRGRKYKAPPPTARIEVSVLRDTDGKPLENASVIFHPEREGQYGAEVERGRQGAH